VSDFDNSLAGFSTGNLVGTLAGIIASATINKTSSVPIGTSRCWDFNPTAASGAIVCNINAGNGDIAAPSTAAGMFSVAAGTSHNITINCRDVFGWTVGVPNTIGVIQQNSAALGTLTVNCRDVLGGTVSCTGGAAVVFNNSASATLTLNATGVVRGGITGATSNVLGAANNNTGIFNLNGTALGGTATGGGCEGFRNVSSGTAYVKKAQSSGSLVNATGANFGAVQVLNAGSILIDESENGAGGWPAISGRSFIRAVGVNQIKMRESNNGLIMTLGEVAADYPVVANVRSGISYNFGVLTGTLAVPPVGSVALGVQTDNTTGTAALSPTALLGATLLARLENCATVESTGDQIAAANP
jgi:hypothetical protein